jgi:hypothetical protein
MIFLYVYLAGFLLTLWLLPWSNYRDDPRDGDVVAGALGHLFASILWPIWWTLVGFELYGNFCADLKAFRDYRRAQQEKKP